jgi:hypothetical protein
VLGTQVDAVEDSTGTVVEPHLLQGPPIDAILDLCEELGPGLLVMGSRGLGPVGRLLVGSVSTNVLRAATGPGAHSRLPRGRGRPGRHAGARPRACGIVKAASSLASKEGPFGQHLGLRRQARPLPRLGRAGYGTRDSVSRWSNTPSRRSSWRPTVPREPSARRPHAAHAWVPLAHFAYPSLVPERYHPPYEEGARRILDEQLGRVEQAGAPSRRRTWSREDPPTRYSTSPNGSAPIS